MKKKHVKTKKTVYIHNFLHTASWQFLKELEETERGSYYNCMASIVFSAFTLEAHLNFVGEKTISFWKTIEQKLSPEQKLEALSCQLSMPLDYGRRPFQSFKELFKFRNSLAHGRTETLSEETIQMLNEGDTPKFPDTNWQKFNSKENAKKYFDDMKGMIEYINKFAEVDFPASVTPEVKEWLITEPDKGINL